MRRISVNTLTLKVITGIKGVGVAYDDRSVACKVRCRQCRPLRIRDDVDFPRRLERPDGLLLQ
jgi:hypothetical protein